MFVSHNLLITHKLQLMKYTKVGLDLSLEELLTSMKLEKTNKK